jgi:enoyl-CoA hydratase/carnithine racemase
MQGAGRSVLSECDAEGVLQITLNRPEKKNAFDAAVWDGLTGALERAREDAEVAAVLVAGAGSDFSAGQDLRAGFEAAMGSGEAGSPRGYAACMEALLELDKPLLAAVRGVAIGIGATFLLHCDIVYLGRSARLRFPFVSMGMVPEAASSYLLPALVGAPRAAEIFYTAEWIDAERAAALGIAARVLPDAEALDAARVTARRIAAQPRSALRATKRCLRAGHMAGIRAALEVERAGLGEQLGSPENLEAIRAFLEKRAPDFRKLLHSQGRPQR